MVAGGCGHIAVRRLWVTRVVPPSVITRVGQMLRRRAISHLAIVNDVALAATA
jgi:hypothetical protein